MRTLISFIDMLSSFKIRETVVRQCETLSETRRRNISCLRVGYILAYIRIKLNAIDPLQEKNQNQIFPQLERPEFSDHRGKGKRKKNKGRRIREEE